MEMPKNGLKKPEDQHKEHPLSPFLFIIVTDVLSRTWIRAEEMGILVGFLVGRRGTRVTLSFFFFNTNVEKLQNLEFILLVFGLILGLKINLYKSTC